MIHKGNRIGRLPRILPALALALQPRRRATAPSKSFGETVFNSLSGFVCYSRRCLGLPWSTQRRQTEGD
jgi:hypothetical protein